METNVISRLLDEKSINKTIEAMTKKIIGAHSDLNNVAIIGMRTRGAHIAERIVANVKKETGTTLELGILDVTFYRDDFRMRFKQPNVQVTKIPFSIDEKEVVIVDDVLYTGRTIRSALNALMDIGRPAKIDLAVLVDRGHRELPIQPEIVGLISETLPSQEIQVRLHEEDGEDVVYIVESPTE